MGEIAPIGDSAGWADAILQVLRNRAWYQRPVPVIAETFSPAETARRYEMLFNQLLGKPMAESDGLDAYARLRREMGQDR